MCFQWMLAVRFGYSTPGTIQHVYTFVYTVQHVYLSTTFGAKGSATKKLSHEGIEVVRLEIFSICTVDTYMQYCVCFKMSINKYPGHNYYVFKLPSRK
jgi:hypothetical protein